MERYANAKIQKAHQKKGRQVLVTIAEFRFTSPHAVNRVGYDDATPDLYVPVRMTKKIQRAIFRPFH